MCPKCSMYPFCFASSNSTTNDVGHFVMHRQDSWPPTKAGRNFKHVAQFPFPAEWGCLHTLKEDTSIFSLQRMCCGGIYHWWHRDTNVGSWGRSVSVWRKYVHDLLCPGLSSFDSATSSTLTAPISNLSLLSMLLPTPPLYILHHLTSHPTWFFHCSHWRLSPILMCHCNCSLLHSTPIAHHCFLHWATPVSLPQWCCLQSCWFHSHVHPGPHSQWELGSFQ